jgi:radical SAM protein with 4Fe4S-binding SPASM domain
MTMKLLNQIREKLKGKADQEEGHSSTSNACLPSPGLDVKIKSYLKNKRPAFRLIYGLRALKEGFRGRKASLRGAGEHIKSTVSFMRGSRVVAGRPMNITIEPTNTCNLRCPVCETGAGILKRTPQHMTMEQFKTVIDKIAPYTNTLMFYFMGEPFLNKHSYDMIAYAKSQGIPFVTTCTNGDLVDPEKLIKCGIDEVSFQIGGMTQETHQVYRINSNLERVFKNLRAALSARKASGTKLRITSGFILMKHNEHQVEEFKRTMTEWGVDTPTIIDPCVRTYEEGLRYLPTDLNHWFYDPEAFNKGRLRPRFYPPNECPWIYYSLSIHVSGNVVPCCRDPLGENVMGNLITQGLDEVWNGEKFKAFRDQLHKDQGSINICRLCSSYGPSPIK